MYKPRETEHPRNLCASNRCASALVSHSDVQPLEVYNSNILNEPISKLYILLRVARGIAGVKQSNHVERDLNGKIILRKAFSKFYRRHFDLLSKYNVRLKTLLLQGLSEPEFYGHLVYKFRKNNW